MRVVLEGQESPTVLNSQPTLTLSPREGEAPECREHVEGRQEDGQEAGGMAQSKLLSVKAGGLEFNPLRIPMKEADTEGRTCDPSPREAETGRPSGIAGQPVSWHW